MSKDARWIQLLSIICLSFMLTNCSSGDRNSNGNRNSSGVWGGDAQAEGGQHGGGGNVKDSTPEQVNRAIDMAIRMVNEPNIPRNVIANFFWDTKDPLIKAKAARIYPKYDKAIDRSDFESTYVSPAFKAFLSNRIDRIPKGDCPHPPDETTADASVSEHTLNAKICFSVGNLTEIPASTILREVLGLVVHEACHMSGCKEDEARSWQDAFTAYFAGRFGDIEIDDFTHPARGNINIASQFLQIAKSHAESNPKSRYVYASMGSVIAQLVSSPYSNDPIAIQLKARPKFPEFIDSYWISVNTLIQKVQASFQPPNPAFIFPLLQNGYPTGLVQEDELLDKLKEIQADLACLSETLDALSTGQLRRECNSKPMDAFARYWALPRNSGNPKNPFMREPKYAEK